MTKIVITKCNNSIAEIECDGHSGYGVEGEDIVCAGISCITQTALLGLLQVACVNVSYEADAKRGYLKIVVPKELSKQDRHNCDIILNTMLIGLSDMYQGFSDFIELEVR